jgi:MFS family permease
MEKEEQTLIEKQPTEASNCSSLSQFGTSLRLLYNGPREFWLINLIILLHGFLYYSVVIILPLFISEEFGYSDIEAGLIFGSMGASFTVFGIILGTTVDKIGVKYTEIISGVSLCIGALVLAFSYQKWLLIISVAVLLPLGGSVGVPTGKIATRRYTTTATRSVAFSIVYMVMNVSAVLGFASDDLFTHGSSSKYLTPYRQIILMSCGLMIFAVIAAFFMREMDYETSGEQPVAPLGSEYSGCQIFKDLVTNSGFWRYFTLVCLAIGIRIVYRSLDATLPKYMERTLGEGAYYGTVLMLNPLTILICTPIFTPLVYFFSCYSLIILGGSISAAS